MTRVLFLERRLLLAATMISIMTSVAELLDDDVVAAFPEFQVQVPRLGEGTFKAAFRASAGEESFVIKILLAGGSSDAGEEVVLDQRFIREINVMSELNSPRIVKLHLPVSTRRIGGSLKVWYAEPLYAGGSLDAILATRKLDRKEAWELAVNLLEALHALEQAGIVHRDIKPGNICKAEDGSFVLLDLGIAKVMSLDPLTATDAVAPRTNRYAAPEQFASRGQTSIDIRTDLFAVGIVLFEAVSGRHPFFEGQSMTFDTYYSRLTDHRPGQLADTDCHPGLPVVIDRCLAARQNRRFRSAGQALKQLHEMGAQI